ncbi:N-acetylneuraminate synthase family protein [Chromobacterium subtsugae]|uniref:N-acetylneuraminate synthase family protein n=1 Tax=Chromobacterium subtsugae TaxID=251747 RepID=A0ABS7FHR0_9NEIS|nr:MULTISPECIES: D-lyxose/D-mannose family sugar isomerase [Chromobacterium]KUM05375.1 spore coat protein [Chromobacterium subtsugae]KZE85238.1 spore coat protein [Chromobacterium sp. F49]MBW7568422.1 N-acetylneuraminate synthase family protein [Chromobacterium subtsugae]MBW8289597.1 N-acetylneuraminate synthase family protein [Chromobacterium subtsugae]WSE92587.1 D-lyxose/D-mannose family sugar isomerase [Chromobacterium subtsugae]
MRKPLFIFEMANNHMGDVEHGIALIRAIRESCQGFDFDFGFKLQYRNLDTFIHPSFKGRDDVKYVKRFEETRLAPEQMLRLVREMKANGFKTICTPFDEESVDLIEAHGIEIIKVASCSFTDWPLLERIARSDKPVVASTAGARREDIDNVVSFMLHRDKDLTIMHCVAEYPTPNENLHLARIRQLRDQYAGVRIGYSTHEDPELMEPVMLAIAQGATVFEKHVGLPTGAYGVNNYSATPEQIRRWIQAAARAFAMLGDGGCDPASTVEQASLRSLRRGVFATRPIKAGESLTEDNVTFAFPPVEGQLTANEWSKYTHYTAAADIAADAPVLSAQLQPQHLRDRVMKTVDAVKALFKTANIVVPGRSDLEISHHYGMERFSEFGLTMVTVINREYCKKLIVMLPEQTHPEQYHLKKEETFIVLYGDITIWLDDEERQAQAGDVITVQRGVRHRFHTRGGVVFEEISSTHYVDDSYYTDERISANKDRKTRLTYWM